MKKERFLNCKNCLIPKVTRTQQYKSLCKKCSNDIMYREARLEALQSNRTCIKCGVEKPNTSDNFYYHTKRLNRLKKTCKMCDDSRKNNWNKKNPEKKNLQSINSYNRYSFEISQKRKIKRKTTDIVQKYFRNYYSNKLSKDPRHRIRSTISHRIYEALKGNKDLTTIEALGYSIAQLKEHLENQFEPWMNWDNYGKYEEGRLKWHIDHIVPHSSFCYTSMHDEAFKKCWALENLRPLEAIENIKKGNKIKIYDTSTEKVYSGSW